MTQAITMAELKRIMDREPDLNDFGYGLYSEHRKKSEAERVAILAKNRQKLLDNIDRVAATCEWIANNLEPIRSINSRRSSYGLKHIAEREIGYITNGVFIAAMLHMGYQSQRNGPNALFNVSEKSVKRAEFA